MKTFFNKNIFGKIDFIITQSEYRIVTPCVDFNFELKILSFCIFLWEFSIVFNNTPIECEISEGFDIDKKSLEYANERFDHVSYTSGKYKNEITDIDKVKESYTDGFNAALFDS